MVALVICAVLAEHGRLRIFVPRPLEHPMCCGVRNLLPLQVPGLANVRALSFGMGHASALLGDGTLRMWGYDGFGQIGVGTSAGGQEILGQNLRVPTLMPLP